MRPPDPLFPAIGPPPDPPGPKAAPPPPPRPPAPGAPPAALLDEFRPATPIDEDAPARLVAPPEPGIAGATPPDAPDMKLSTTFGDMKPLLSPHPDAMLKTD